MSRPELPVARCLRLDPVTRQLLTEAVAGCEASALVLEDRLDELGLEGALEAWRWARQHSKDPAYELGKVHKKRSGWYLRSCSFAETYPEEPDDLPAEGDRDTGSWFKFSDIMEAWQWLLLEWGRWERWT